VHLDRGTGTKIEINTENHLPAVVATAVKEQLLNGAGDQTAIQRAVLVIPVCSCHMTP
jgi:hypothetical protein